MAYQQKRRYFKKLLLFVVNCTLCCSCCCLINSVLFVCGRGLFDWWIWGGIYTYIHIIFSPRNAPSFKEHRPTHQPSHSSVGFHNPCHTDPHTRRHTQHLHDSTVTPIVCRTKPRRRTGLLSSFIMTQGERMCTRTYIQSSQRSDINKHLLKLSVTL